MVKEIKNKERLRYGLLEYMASGLISFLLLSKLPPWVNEKVFMGYIVWIIAIIWWYGIPLLLKGNHIIGNLLRFSVVNEQGKILSGKEIIARQTFKLMLLVTFIV